MGLLNPLNLLLGLSLAALVAIYLRAQARPAIQVLSLALFDEAPAPVARSRILRVDLLFWVEAAALATLTLVAAGFYVRMAAPVNRPLRRALIFDLGASMNAVDANGTRLTAAQRHARALVDGAPPGDQFKVVGYALDARVMRAEVSRKRDIERAVDALRATAVAARPAALRAALNNANRREDRPLHRSSARSGVAQEARSRAGWSSIRSAARLTTSRWWRSSPGRRKCRGPLPGAQFCLPSRETCELRIELDGRQVFDSPLMIRDRGRWPRCVSGHSRKVACFDRPFTPADGLAADNDRYALAPKGPGMRALVVSPDSAARDDLARVLVAVNSGIRLLPGPARWTAQRRSDGKQAGPNFDLAILHDTNDTGSAAPAHLFVFPPLGQTGTGAAPIPVTGTPPRSNCSPVRELPPWRHPYCWAPRACSRSPDGWTRWPKAPTPLSGRLCRWPQPATRHRARSG